MGKKTITFVIDSEDGITAYASRQAAAEQQNDAGKLFSTREQLDEATVGVSGPRLVEIWNSIPGVTAVKKFTNRKIALDRIWKGIQVLAADLAADTAEEVPDVAPEKDKPAGKAGRARKPRTKAAVTMVTLSEASEPRADSKKAQVIDMVRQSGGATLKAIMAATGWQPHTVRGFMATVPKKLGIAIVSTKVDGERTYSAAAGL